MNKVQLRDEDEIQRRKVGDPVPEISALDPGLGQYQFRDLLQAVEFAKIMCQAGPMLPEHAQGNPAICVALTLRAVHWGFDPFALAYESFQAKQGGPIGFQAKVFTAVMRKAGVLLNYRFEGSFKKTGQPVKSAKGNVVAQDGAAGDRKCIAYLEEGGRLLEYETPTLDEITIKNSPLWHNDPDQQLAYYAGRGWARRHRPDLMMGAYSDDEVRDMRGMRDVTPKTSGFVSLAQKARNQTSPDETEPAGKDDEAPEDQDHEIRGNTPATVTPDDVDETEDQDDAIDTDSLEYLNGVTAAKGGLGRGECPYREDPAAAAAWFAGHDSVTEKQQDEEHDPETA